MRRQVLATALALAVLPLVACGSADAADPPRAGRTVPPSAIVTVMPPANVRTPAEREALQVLRQFAPELDDYPDDELYDGLWLACDSNAGIEDVVREVTIVRPDGTVRAQLPLNHAYKIVVTARSELCK
jgi:hypothetical protein